LGYLPRHGRLSPDVPKRSPRALNRRIVSSAIRPLFRPGCGPDCHLFGTKEPRYDPVSPSSTRPDPCRSWWLWPAPFAVAVAARPAPSAPRPLNSPRRLPQPQLAVIAKLAAFCLPNPGDAAQNSCARRGPSQSSNRQGAQGEDVLGPRPATSKSCTSAKARSAFLTFCHGHLPAETLNGDAPRDQRAGAQYVAKAIMLPKARRRSDGGLQDYLKQGRYAWPATPYD